MRLTPERFTFMARSYKLLSFYITERGVEANLNKWEVVIWMNLLTLKKEVLKIEQYVNFLEQIHFKIHLAFFPFYMILRK